MRVFLIFITIVSTIECTASSDGISMEISGPVKIIICNNETTFSSSNIKPANSTKDIGIQGCSEGFFQINGSSQCFKFHTDGFYGWETSRKKCTDEGLELAQPADEIAVAVRDHIIATYGDKWVWVGARNTRIEGSRDVETVWQNPRRGNHTRTLSKGNSLWFRSYLPGGSYRDDPDACLYIVAYTQYRDYWPEQIYYLGPCYGTMYPLCEAVNPTNA